MTDPEIFREPRALISRRMLLAAFLLCVIVINAFALGSLKLLERDQESYQFVLQAALAQTRADAPPIPPQDLQRIEQQKMRSERDLRILLGMMALVSLIMVVALFWRIDRLWALWKKALLEAQHQAHHDDLTGLPNARLLKDRLEIALAHARRVQQKVAVVVADFDGFTQVNEQYGAGTGDEVLKQAAMRLQRLCRDADTVARTAGDEFVLVLSDVHSEADVEAFAERLMASLGATYEILGSEIVLDATVGIAVFSGQAASAESLLRSANASLVGAKRSGSDQAALA